MDNQGNEKSRSLSEGAAATAARLKKQVSDAAEDARNKAGDMAQTAADKIDEQRDRAAIAFDRTAASLHQRKQAFSDAAQATSDKLQATADYLHEHDARAIVEDLKELVRRHPGPAIATATIFGFAFASLFRRKR
jgi:ElaB/YqjD/DUF883 family membrane-anchored ribosome-binding protein